MTSAAKPVFPFAAIVGQEELKTALLLNAVDPRIGGVMIMGRRGTAKSTAVRAVAEIAPPIETIEGCPFRCEPNAALGLCGACREPGARPVACLIPMPVVDLPLGATEDRVAGTLDLEAALVRGKKIFEPGLLARAHRGFLYIDETNLLEDHLVDLLLDVAAAGEHVVERESISVRHPARFVLVGSGNPEEGELRPQLLDRFGLYVAVEGETDAASRAEIVRRRLAFDDDPAGFRARFAAATDALAAALVEGRARLARTTVPGTILDRIALATAALAIDGHRGELTLVRSARAAAALAGRLEATEADVRRVAAASLRHRLRRDPLETRDASHRIAAVIDEFFPPQEESTR